MLAQNIPLVLDILTTPVNPPLLMQLGDPVTLALCPVTVEKASHRHILLLLDTLVFLRGTHLPLAAPSMT
jgi:hypothetical protein